MMTINRESLFQILKEFSLDNKTTNLVKTILTIIHPKVKFRGEISRQFKVKCESEREMNFYHCFLIVFLRKAMRAYLKSINSSVFGFPLININILNSCPTQGRVEGWDAMKPLYYKSVSSKGAGRPRLSHHHKGGWNETDEMSVDKWWNEICGRGKREKHREKPTQTPFRPPRNPHGGTETRTRDPSDGRRAPNRLHHEAAIILY